MENEHEFQDDKKTNNNDETTLTVKNFVVNIFAGIGFISVCALVGIKVLGETIKGIIKD